MNPKVVLFGGADYGKSTVIGYLYAESLNLDMDKVERRLRENSGKYYKPDIVYSSLINPDVLESVTTEKVQMVENAANLTAGDRILKDSEYEYITQSISLIGSTAKIITRTNKKKLNERLNSKVHHLRNVKIDSFGISEKVTMIDTPGHSQYLGERELGISMSDVGVFCLAINEVIKDNFAKSMNRYTDLWFQYNANRKLIYLLTKFDLLSYSQDAYEEACDRIKQYCQHVNTKHKETIFGADLDFYVEEPDVAAIIPVAVEFVEREGVNLVTHNSKTPWYCGPTLVTAIRERMYEISNI